MLEESEEEIEEPELISQNLYSPLSAQEVEFYWEMFET